MTIPTEEGRAVVPCPGCDKTGKVMKFQARMKVVVSLIHDYERCPMCEGSGLVFVVPARVIGPYVAPK